MTPANVPVVRFLELALAFAMVAGCFGDEPDARASLVPYPRLGDVVVYEATGALVELARWENGIPFGAATAQVRFTVGAAADTLDGARALHAAYKVTTDVAEAGVFDHRSDRYVSARHGAVVQSYHPLSQDQSIVAFDERGFPWLFGASVLLGEELGPDARIPFDLPDNLGRGQTIAASWHVVGEEEGDWKLALEGLPGVEGTLWMEPGSAWPTRVSLAIADASLAPHVRSDGGYPVRMDAVRASLTPGADPVPPRDRGATFADDASVARATWDGEKPPDGDITNISYALSAAVADAKLLDRPLQDWLAAADTPILYRATFQEEAGPIEGSTSALWLLQWVDRSEAYYEVQISKTFPPPPPALPAPLPVPLPGVPQVVSSAPADPPESEGHGWFARDAVPTDIVPLSEGIRLVRDTFGATDVQIFLRSFTDPPGYSYFLDGGFEEGGVGRYTVVYNPNTGFIEEATGPVGPKLSGS